MKHDESARLLYGPYSPPVCRVGGMLECEALGREVIVGGMHDSPIPWPYRRKKGRHSLILCGDLVRAVRVESEKAVVHHWGVSPTTVYLWRKALGVGKWTEGTTRLILESIERGRKASRSPESRAKMSQAKAGKPISSKLRAAALEAAKRPKSDAWKRAKSEQMLKEWANGTRRRGPAGG
jgi:hypothetical protein